MNHSTSPVGGLDDIHGSVLDALYPNGSIIVANWTEPTLGCFEWKPSNHVLFQAANAIIFLGLLAPEWKRGLLFLHSMFVVGFLLLSAWAWMIVCAPDIFSWNFVFMVINVIQTLLLLYSIRPIKLHRDLELLYADLFRPMNVSRPAFKKLVCSDYCSLGSLQDGENYAMQGVSKTDRLGILISGTMKVLSHHTLLHLIRTKEFIDSPEFESSVTGEEKYQVSIMADGPCRYVCWSRQGLEYLLLKEPFLGTVINTLMGRDITNKLYSLNDRVTACIGSRQDIRLPSVASSQRRTSQDLRRALAVVNAEALKHADKKTLNVNFIEDRPEEEDRDSIEDHYSVLEEQVDLLNGKIISSDRPGRKSRFSCSSNSSPARSSASNVSGVHFNI